jgi:hypothetical protein
MREIQTAVERVDRWSAHQPGERERQVVHVTVDQVKLVCVLEYLGKLYHVRGKRIGVSGVQPQGARNRRNYVGRGARVPAREEGDLMASADLFLDEIGDDALSAAVEHRRHALVERSDMSNSHECTQLQAHCQVAGRTCPHLQEILL